ncbi:39S ribosomal protein L53, mitochondrial isoform X2 [Nothoprocta perdicaria]|uniref:39S ribosomal protein L53, mitochondrial isoform X2 n=1 Tax=Nothoprocta perdicaria TaxID=30464 RepID=UPI000E1B642A|nr:39S ribosomal protein L53, mitochondrial isoform X2 [Nothoprocta perdicaria]
MGPVTLHGVLRRKSGAEGVNLIFLQRIYHKNIYDTNRNCEVTTDVRHDGSEPLIDVMFADGDRLIMKGANLTAVEMLTALSSRCNAKEQKAEQKSKKKNP